MTMDWFRSWHNAPTDPKWLLIARRANVAPGMVSAVFWALLDYASQEKDRGSVAGFDHETYAGWAGWDESEVLAILDAMRSKGVITAGDRLSSWEKRQVKREDEGGADRVAKHRANKASVTNDDVTHYDNVTQSNAMKRAVTQSNPRLDESRLEKMSECEVPVSAGASPTYPPGFEEFESVFKMNLVTEVKERDPKQSMMGGFSFDDTSRALLLQVYSKGPILSSKAVAWGIDQWEQSKKDQRFRVQDRGCINWLLTTIYNSYKPGANGTDPTVRKSNVPATPAAEQAAAEARQAAYEQQIAEELERAGLLK